MAMVCTHCSCSFLRSIISSSSTPSRFRIQSPTTYPNMASSFNAITQCFGGSTNVADCTCTHCCSKRDSDAERTVDLRDIPNSHHGE